MKTTNNNNAAPTIKGVNESAKATNKVFASAKSDVRNISPFYFINQLNKLAKKNGFCEHVNVHEALKQVETIFNCKGFEANILHKDSYYNTFCNLVNIPKANENRTIDLSFEDLVIITTIDKKGKSHVSEFERVNETQMFKPVTPTLLGYLNAFQVRTKEYYKGLKQAIRNTNKQAKASK